MASDSKRSIEWPENWGFTQVTLHFEGDDLSDEAKPFAGNIVVQLRLDIEPGASAEATRDIDMSNLRRTLPNVEVLGSGELDLGGRIGQYMEWTSVVDDDLGPLQQLAVYIPVGSRLYAVTGTHKEAKFGAVRHDILDVASSLFRA